LINQKK